jgi:putative ABC transport system permease protein
VNLSDLFRSALDDLGRHLLRSVLTMLGMVFGVAAVIAMLAIGAGAERQALEMIERLGVRNVLLRDAELRDDQLAEARETSPGLSRRDLLAIVDAVPGVERILGRVEIESYSVLADGITTDATVHGVSPGYGELAGLRLLEGRFLDALDEETHAQTCVIGRVVRQELFGYGTAVGRDLKVNDVWLEVVGVLAGTGSATTVQGVTVGGTDHEIYVPLSTAIRKFEHPSLDAPLDEIIVRLAPGISPEETATLIAPLLDRLHGGVEDFNVVVPRALIEQSRRTQRLFSLVMGCIAGISLLVGGIGITNIMLATVLERTREIGIRAAVGATKRDIRHLFLFESFAISVTGGILGIVVGVAVASIVAASAGWPTVVTPFSVLLSFSVSITVGLVSGLYPAVRAADLEPIEALRYE